MRTLIFFFVFAAASALAQSQTEAPRVNTTGEQAGAKVSLNQVDTSRYPEVVIFATVTRNDEPVKGLTAADFRVREDEVDQEPVSVAPKLSPMSVVLTLDTSGSIKKSLPVAQQAASAFVKTLDKEDRVTALSFAREVTTLVSDATDRAAVGEAINATVARGDTALYDALYQSVHVLKEKAGRKAIVLLSDGVDDDGMGKQLSKHSVEDVLAYAQTLNVPIFTIGLGNEIDETVLRRVAEATGAAYFHSPTAEQLIQLYESIGKQLSGQYTISYSSNLPADGTVHRIQISHAGLTSTKEYEAPRSTQGPTPPPGAKVVKKVTFGLGTIKVTKIPVKAPLVIKSSADKQYVDTIGERDVSISVPAHEYSVCQGNVCGAPFKVGAGESVEAPVGNIQTSMLKNAANTLIINDAANNYAETLSTKDPVSSVPAGEYKLCVGNSCGSTFSVKAGDVVEPPVGIIDGSASEIASQVELKTATDAWVDQITNKAKVLALPEGNYKICKGNFCGEPFEVKAGETVETDIGG